MVVMVAVDLEDVVEPSILIVPQGPLLPQYFQPLDRCTSMVVLASPHKAELLFHKFLFLQVMVVMAQSRRWLCIVVAALGVVVVEVVVIVALVTFRSLKISIHHFSPLYHSSPIP